MLLQTCFFLILFMSVMSCISGALPVKSRTPFNKPYFFNVSNALLFSIIHPFAQHACSAIFLSFCRPSHMKSLYLEAAEGAQRRLLVDLAQRQCALHCRIQSQSHSQESRSSSKDAKHDDAVLAGHAAQECIFI